MSGFKRMPPLPSSPATAHLGGFNELETPGNSSSSIKINPAQTRIHPLNRRAAASMAGQAIQTLADSIRSQGQSVPARGYWDESEGHKVVTLLYGARRRAACLTLGIDLHVDIIEQPSDAQAVKIMYGENRGRRDYSALEEGREFKAYLESGRFPTIASLALALGEEETRMRRCISIAELPDAILKAFPDPTALTMSLGDAIAKGLKSEASASRIMAVAESCDGSSDPSRLFNESLSTPKPLAKVYVEVRSDTGRKCGTVKGGEATSDPLLINLDAKAPATLKAELIEVLRRHRAWGALP